MSTYHATIRLFLSICVSQLAVGLSAAQSIEVSAPFQKIEGKYLDIVTDLPLDDELRGLPKVFEAAMPTWCRVFDLNVGQIQDWHCTAFIMLDRARFQAAGFIPKHLPEFPYGYQFGNQLWVSEQPSAYYRRHLLLHEGTHWFMNRKYGGNGPPWLMEGMAEWLGTHRWDPASQQLEMGIIPTEKTEVPYWGRITLIQNQLASGLAPSLETIMRYGNTAHQQVDAYAWSWAAVVFMRNHPRTKATFQALLRRPMRSDLTLTRWLFGQLRTKWPMVRQEWNTMLADLEYGFDPSRGLLTLSNDLAALPQAPTHLVVQADQSWQASGIQVRDGDRLGVEAAGQYVVCTEPQPWKCTPEGVTLEYFQGAPLGALMMTVVAPIQTEPDFSLPASGLPVGSASSLTAAQDGELHFRINEGSSGLADNSGQIQVTIRRK